MAKHQYSLKVVLHRGNPVNRSCICNGAHTISTSSVGQDANYQTPSG